jgi:serine/threonine-protein kinase RIM15
VSFSLYPGILADLKVIAATSYEQSEIITEEGTLFSAVINKPVTKAVLVKTLAKLGFELSASGGDEPTRHPSTSSYGQETASAPGP